MSDSVSILGKLDFGRPRLSSPPAAALAGNQLLFTGERFSPKNPVGCWDTQSRMRNPSLWPKKKSLLPDGLVMFWSSRWRWRWYFRLLMCLDPGVSLRAASAASRTLQPCGPRVCSVITPSGKLLITLAVMWHLQHRSLMGQCDRMGQCVSVCVFCMC